MTLDNVLSKMPECHDSRDCFARAGNRCRILAETYLFDGDCPFCKRDRDDKRREEENTQELLPD